MPPDNGGDFETSANVRSNLTQPLKKERLNVDVIEVRHEPAAQMPPRIGVPYFVGVGKERVTCRVQPRTFRQRDFRPLRQLGELVSYRVVRPPVAPLRGEDVCPVPFLAPLGIRRKPLPNFGTWPIQSCSSAC
jgi:hypothetical protein